MSLCVDLSGFEPLTSALQMRRSTNEARGLDVAQHWPEIVVELASWHKLSTAMSELVRS